MRHFKSALAAASVATLLLSTSGCERPADPAADASTPEASEEPVATQASPSTEAADAGGACVYLDFAEVTEATGQPFTIVQAGGADEVTSCVLLTTAGQLPDITFTQAKTVADADTYRSEIQPKGGEEVEDLGKAAYSAVRDAVKGGGPVVEIGWLTKGHMYSLRYTTAKDTTDDEAAAVVEPLIEVVRAVADRAAADEKKEDKD